MKLSDFIFVFISFIFHLIHYTQQSGILSKDSSQINAPPLEKLKEKFSAEWEKSLNNINPEHFFTFDLQGRKKTTFVEVFDTVPVDVEGAFFSSDREEEKIYFYVIKDGGGIAYHSTSNEKVFKFRINQPGRYKIIFDNKYNDKKLTITFSLGTKQNQILSVNKLEATTQKIKKLEGFMKSVYVDEEFMRNKYKERVKGKKTP